jgi:hypothetical protein
MYTFIVCISLIVITLHIGECFEVEPCEIDVKLPSDITSCEVRQCRFDIIRREPVIDMASCNFLYLPFPIARGQTVIEIIPTSAVIAILRFSTPTKQSMYMSVSTNSMRFVDYNGIQYDFTFPVRRRVAIFIEPVRTDLIRIGIKETGIHHEIEIEFAMYMMKIEVLSGGYSIVQLQTGDKMDLINLTRQGTGDCRIHYEDIDTVRVSPVVYGLTYDVYNNVITLPTSYLLQCLIMNEYRTDIWDVTYDMTCYDTLNRFIVVKIPLFVDLDPFST